jgi:formate dehydrogenase iron-sulfur subunit
MSVRIYVPMDTTAVALGADRVADAIEAQGSERDLQIELVRNGSRGAFFLEPLVEVEHGEQRLAFGPMTTDKVSSLLDALGADPAAHELCLGPAQEIPWLRDQKRLTFMRAGQGDPDCRRDNRVRLARSRRRRLSRRHQVAHGARYTGAAEVHCL